MNIYQLLESKEPWIHNDGMGILTPDLFHEIIRHPVLCHHLKVSELWSFLLQPTWTVADHGFHIEDYLDVLEAYPPSMYREHLPDNFVFIAVPEHYPQLRLYQQDILKRNSTILFNSYIYDNEDHFHYHISQAAAYLQHQPNYNNFFASTIWFHDVPMTPMALPAFMEQYPTPTLLYQDVGYSEGFTWTHLLRHLKNLPDYQQQYDAFFTDSSIPPEPWDLLTLLDTIHQRYGTESWWTVIFADNSYDNLHLELSYDQYDDDAIRTLATPYLQAARQAIYAPTHHSSEELFF